jgi:DNA-binding NarL/FixJ family response regulator
MNTVLKHPQIHGGQRIRILIVEDEAPIREALAALVEQHPKLTLAGAAASLAAARMLLATPHDVVLVDLRLGDGSGVELIREIAARGTSRSLVISVFGDEASVLSAIEAGADGYLIKDAPNIADSILDVMQGGSPMSPAIAVHLLRRFRRAHAAADSAAASAAAASAARLAPRELELLDCFARGLSYREAAAELSLSTHTVADYVKSVYRKLAVNSRSQAVFEAVQAGLIRIQRH